ncbi:MAG: LysR family transcriptional regulator [Clostridia bacterium]|nr:LysR family transcriptional regulator [Clostridia bacterium]
MELLQLRYFLESAKYESFSQTAKLYFVPVTSVSASVKRLEKELGQELFDRRANRIVLNERGRRLYDALSRGLAKIDDAIFAASLREDEAREISVLVRAMRRRVTDAVIAFRRTLPGVSFRIAFDTDQQDPASFDLIVDADSPFYPDRERFAWYETPLRLAVASGDPACGIKRTLFDLKDRDFLSMGAGSNTHAILKRACESAGFEPRIAVTCNDIECFEKLVAAGVGVGVMREEEEQALPGIRFLSVADFREQYVVYVYYRKTAPSDGIRRFVSFLRDGDGRV